MISILKNWLPILLCFFLFSKASKAQTFGLKDSIFYDNMLHSISNGNNQDRCNYIKSFVQSHKLEGLHVYEESIDWFGLYKNVVVEKIGAIDSVVYVVCHYDKIDGNIFYLFNTIANGIFDVALSNIVLSKGSYDNGSGVIVALNMLMWINSVDTKYTYRFLFAGMEEYGLRGSRRFVSGIKQDEWAKSVYAINIDMIGHKLTKGISIIENVSDSSLIKATENICLQANYDLTKSKLPKGAMGDYRSFSKQSFLRDFSVSLKVNMFGACVPQRSYFTKVKVAIPVINFTDAFTLSLSDMISMLSPISFGQIHSFRDNEAVVDLNNLFIYNAFFKKLIIDLEN